MNGSENFWNDKRNKYKFFIIFKFAGLDSLKFLRLNRNTLSLFKNEIHSLNRVWKIICTNMNSITTFEEFLNDSMALFSFGYVFERAKHDNEIFNIDFFIKLIVLDLIYCKFKDDLRNEVLIAYELSDISFRFFLELYLCLSYYVNRDMNFKYISFSNNAVKKTKLIILRDFLCSLKDEKNLANKFSTFLDRNNSLNSKYLNDKIALSFEMSDLCDGSLQIVSEVMDKGFIKTLEFKNNIGRNTNFNNVFNSLNKSGLESLKLDNTRLEDSCLNHLAISLSFNKTLQHLSISKYIIENNCLKGILDTLAEVEGFKSLTLSKCSLGDKESKLISKFLQRKKDLQNLDLSENNLTNKGVKAIFAALSNKEAKLKSLILNMNIFDHNIATKLVVLFRINAFLSFIEMGCLKLSKETLELAMQNRGDNMEIRSKLCRLVTFRMEQLEVKCNNYCELCS
jgi:hypothetical protein